MICQMRGFHVWIRHGTGSSSSWVIWSDHQVCLICGETEQMEQTNPVKLVP